MEALVALLVALVVAGIFGGIAYWIATALIKADHTIAVLISLGVALIAFIIALRNPLF